MWPRAMERENPLMSVSGTAITTALSALKMYSRRVDRSAEQIASVGLTELPTDSGDAAGMPGLPAPTGGAPTSPRR